MKYKTNLKKHMLLHSGEKNYKCNQCPFESYQAGNLQTHMKIHGEKTIHCKECDWSAFRAWDLKVHMKKTHSGEKPSKCDKCEYSSFDMSHLKRHMKVHAGKI